MYTWHGYCIQNNDDSVESLEDKCFFWENINCIDTVIGESFLLRQNGIRKGTKREEVVFPPEKKSGNIISRHERSLSIK